MTNTLSRAPRIETLDAAAHDLIVMDVALAEIARMVTLPLADDEEVTIAQKTMKTLISDALNRTSGAASTQRDMLRSVARQIDTLSEIPDEAAYGIWDIARGVLNGTKHMNPGTLSAAKSMTFDHAVTA
ncbi:hypothetical protein ACOI1H_21650 [Loktanella sp. DJP18]|uniref:hypothetical protein n=1 Tax=Loktanella sp. DJP18 TaxID=3409788 RepID=UPI003BB4EF7B